MKNHTDIISEINTRAPNISKYLTSRITEHNRKGLTFNVIDSGPLDGKLIVLLHGFPETASSWNQVSNILNEHGYRTLAIDQRGYSPAASPKGRFKYSVAELVEDVYSLIKTLDQPVYLMGHDWGSIVACELALKHPEAVTHLTLVSVPHKGAFLKAMLSSTQIFSSYYMGLFQLPIIPEFMFKRTKFLGHYFLRNSGMTPEQLSTFDKDFIQENRLGTAINWYRSMLISSPLSLFKKVDVPTLFVWGSEDIAVSKKSADLNKNFFSNQYHEVFIKTTHWIPAQNPNELSQYFLNAVS
ncbi:alpha/beta fold hydrolase [Acinetobacter sp. XS-4]|uniref:alpha/beta fold hydrolase n=1 Tax=Acinetobacter sp. XS-4 TaxID=2923375 RepID=UPI00208E1244|nr:alpha/beta fold hydrolase [Acinetobacter sp. XS-4]USP39293.1 alpha/beta fold hydrolase [Acinetobacter sp. XS-4]